MILYTKLLRRLEIPRLGKLMKNDMNIYTFGYLKGKSDLGESDEALNSNNLSFTYSPEYG